MPTKRCTRCDRRLPLDAFHRDRSKRDGRVSRCRDCLSAIRRARRRQTAAKRRERDRAALAANPTARRSRRRQAAAVADLTPAPDPAAARRIADAADAALRRKLA